MIHIEAVFIQILFFAKKNIGIQLIRTLLLLLSLLLSLSLSLSLSANGLPKVRAKQRLGIPANDLVPQRGR